MTLLQKWPHIQEYTKTLKILMKKLNKQHRCNNRNCGKELPEEAFKRRVCKACKSANCWDKICQKLIGVTNIEENALQFTQKN